MPPPYTGDQLLGSASGNAFSPSNPPADVAYVNFLAADIASKASTTYVNTELNNRVIKNSAISAGTGTKYTVDSKGLITGRSNATTADILESFNKNYVTDSDIETLQSLKRPLNLVSAILPSYSNVLSVTGIETPAFLSNGSNTTPVQTATSYLTKTKRFSMASLAATGGWFGGFYLQKFDGTISNHIKAIFRFGTSVTASGNSAFVGLSARGTTAPAATELDPINSTTYSKIGMAINTNTGNWQLIWNTAGSSVQVNDLGTNFAVDNTSIYELSIQCNGVNSVSVTVYNQVNNVEARYTLTANLPSANEFLARYMYITPRNGSATAVTLDMCFANLYTV